ncbi:MAG: hypothetical protein SGILL_009851, partial [Bacillariaceae sp.]
WPTVLARLAREIPQRRSQYGMYDMAAPNAANGLYHLIRHGPIFAGKMDQKDAQQGIPSAKPMTSGAHPDKKRKADPALGGFSSPEEVLQHSGLQK